jgi:hypothetical protein
LLNRSGQILTAPNDRFFAELIFQTLHRPNLGDNIIAE